MKIRATLTWLTLLALASPGWSRVHEYRTLELADGTRLEYALVLPADFDRHRQYPALLGLPPGAQDRAMVEAGLSRYWQDAAAARGWIIVSPVAPEGIAFHKGSESFIPPLLDAIEKRFHIVGDKLHLAGVSNGGLSAFRVALEWPERFQSLTVLPGFPPTPRDETRLERLRGMPVHLFAGGDDKDWANAARSTQEKLETLGIPVQVEVFPGEGHVPPSMTAHRFLDLLESLRAR